MAEGTETSDTTNTVQEIPEKIGLNAGPADAPTTAPVPPATVTTFPSIASPTATASAPATAPAGAIPPTPPTAPATVPAGAVPPTPPTAQAEADEDPRTINEAPTQVSGEGPRIKLFQIIVGAIIGLAGALLPYFRLWIENSRNIEEKNKTQIKLVDLQTNGEPSAGWYLNPDDNGLMANIVKQAEAQACAITPSDIYIQSDVATFGSFSHPALYQRYLSAIETAIKKAKAANKTTKAIFHSPKVASDFFALQFPEDHWDSTLADWSFQQKLRAWFARQDVRNAIIARGVMTFADEQKYTGDLASNLKREKFFECIQAHNEEVIRELQSAGLKVKRSTAALSSHLWLYKGDSQEASQRKGIVGLVDFSQNVDELGIFVRGDVHVATAKLADELFDSLPQ